MCKTIHQKYSVFHNLTSFKWKAAPIPRGKAHGKLAELGLCGEIVINSNWTNERVIEVTSLFGHVFDLQEGECHPFKYLGIISGTRHLGGVNLHCRVANMRKVAWEVFGNSYRAFNR